jgi:hypothetical protein
MLPECCAVRNSNDCPSIGHQCTLQAFPRILPVSHPSVSCSRAISFSVAGAVAVDSMPGLSLTPSYRKLVTLAVEIRAGNGASGRGWTDAVPSVSFVLGSAGSRAPAKAMEVPVRRKTPNVPGSELRRHLRKRDRVK